MNEVKIELPKTQTFTNADIQTYQTLDDKAAEPQVEVYFPSDPNRDLIVTNADGTITRVAYTVNINGAQWIIPAAQRTKIPQSVYEYLTQCIEMQSKAMEPIPMRQIGAF